MVPQNIDGHNWGRIAKRQQHQTTEGHREAENSDLSHPTVYRPAHRPQATCQPGV